MLHRTVVSTAVAVLNAPAKLTLSLRVVGTRPDGLHLIDAEMVSLDLHDTIEVTSGSGVDVVDAATGVVIELAGVNLVTTALESCEREARITITKRIPAGAGLGGGSSNAAAVLRWAGCRDLERSAAIGADVAFCLYGGRARVTGIGEQIQPLEFQPQTFTLLTPDIGCRTAAVYAEWDRLGGPKGEYGNDLEPAALSLYPDLRRWRDMLAKASGQRPRLAGSGSSWFVSGAYPGAGRVVARTIPAHGL